MHKSGLANFYFEPDVMDQTLLQLGVPTKSATFTIWVFLWVQTFSKALGSVVIRVLKRLSGLKGPLFSVDGLSTLMILLSVIPTPIYLCSRLQLVLLL